jgi:diadenosine tetraphosphate (Ap4A) HIT family hydrolase
MSNPTIFSSAPGHVLVVPFRHVADFFSLTFEEKQAILMLLDGAKD